MIVTPPDFQIQSPSGSLSSSRVSLAQRLHLRMATKTLNFSTPSDKENLDPNTQFIESPLAIAFNNWKTIHLENQAARTLPVLIEQHRKISALRCLRSAIQITVKTKELQGKQRRKAAKQFFLVGNTKGTGDRVAGFERVIKRMRKRNAFKDLYTTITTKRQFNTYIRQLDLSRYFSALREHTTQQTKIRSFRFNSNKDSLTKCFNILVSRVNTTARVIAMSHIKQTDLLFQIFKAWQTYHLTKKLTRYNQQELMQIRESKDKAEFVLALKNHQSLVQLKFIKERQADRYNVLRLQSTFYPMMRVLRELQAIRIKSIRIGMVMARRRKDQAMNTMACQFRRRLRKIREYTNTRQVRLVKQIYLRWQKISGIHFINRKQYQLSVMFHRAKLQSKCLNSMLKIVEIGRPIKQKSVELQRILKVSRGKVFLNNLLKLARDALFQGKIRDSRIQGLKRLALDQMRTQSLASRSTSQQNWLTRKKSATLSKLLKSTRKQLAMRVLANFTRYRLSQLLMKHYADQLYQKRLLSRFFHRLLHL